MIIAVLLGLVGVYVAVALVTATAARSSRSSPASTSAPASFVSVIVAARNEEETLGACVQALKSQFHDAYEIIVADDHSSDRTREIAAEQNVRCIDVPDGRSGKAAAIHAAVESARGDVLVVTDADCRPPPNWLAEMTGVFRDDGVGMVCGVTAVAGTSLLSRIQAMDWALLLTVAAGLSAMGFPLSAMGNNMAFRREAYESLGGYPALKPTVTEDYALFRAIDRQTSWNVRLLLGGGLTNVTLPLPTLREVIQQRKRWARGGLRAGPWMYLFYGLVYATHGAIVAGLVLVPGWALAALAAKVAADAVVVHVAGKSLGQRHIRPAFLLFELYLFAYVLALPFLLAVSPRIKWRGRRW